MDANCTLSDIERSAYLNRPMPDGLSFPEQQLFLALRNLYDSASKGIVSKETGAKEKSALMEQFRIAQFREGLEKYWTDLLKQTEKARSEFRKHPDVETACKIVEVIDGIPVKLEYEQEAMKL